MTSDVDRKALREALGALETRLEAYLVEWQRQLGIPKRPEADIDPEEQHPVATEWAERRR
jgi:hypothetical protein